MPQLIALTCPVCAAPLQPNSDRCGYCGSLIYIKTDVPRLSLKQLNQSVIEESITSFRKRVRADQYDQDAHYGLGVAYFNLGLIEEAIDELTQAARLMPENADIQVQLAVVLHSSFRAGNAAAEGQMNARLRRALLLKPDHFEANMLKAEELIADRNYTEADTTLQPMMLVDPVRAKPKLVTVLESLGTQRLAQQNWEGAKRCWTKLEPIDSEAAKDLAVRFLNQNSSYLPKTVRLGEAVKTLSTQSAPGRVTRTILISLGGLVGGFIVWLIIVIILGIGSDKISGWAYLPFLLGFLGFLASPFIAGIWYWKRSSTQVIAPALGTPLSQRKISRTNLLSGAADTETVYQVADELVSKLAWVKTAK